MQYFQCNIFNIFTPYAGSATRGGGGGGGQVGCTVATFEAGISHTNAYAWKEGGALMQWLKLSAW